MERLAMQFAYVIKYVADMDRAVRYFRDTLSLPVKFQSPHWSELQTGETTLALHLATPDVPVGTIRLGFGTEDVNAFYAERETRGVNFVSAPEPLHGATIARFLDCDGAECGLSSGRGG
jgi:catechol 2,3-dioxygenase-like lactoylglutathione lyase family enzyme